VVQGGSNFLVSGWNLVFDYSSESYWAVFPWGTVYIVKGWGPNHCMWLFQRKLLSMWWCQSSVCWKKQFFSLPVLTLEVKELWLHNQAGCCLYSNCRLPSLHHLSCCHSIKIHPDRDRHHTWKLAKTNNKEKRYYNQTSYDTCYIPAWFTPFVLSVKTISCSAFFRICNFC